MRFQDLMLYVCAFVEKYKGKDVSHMFPKINGSPLIVNGNIIIEDNIVIADIDSMWGIEFCANGSSICYWSNEYKWVPIYKIFTYVDII